jgi:very-short-patch-repair endonuclease
MLRLSRAVGLPRPEVNKWLDLGDGEGLVRADFMWPEQRLVLEVDGRKHHGTRQRFESDRRRDQRMMVAGLRCIRTTDKQIKHRPRQLETTVLALLRASKLGL